MYIHVFCTPLLYILYTFLKWYPVQCTPLLYTGILFTSSIYTRYPVHLFYIHASCTVYTSSLIQVYCTLLLLTGILYSVHCIYILGSLYTSSIYRHPVHCVYKPVSCTLLIYTGFLNTSSIYRFPVHLFYICTGFLNI